MKDVVQGSTQHKKRNLKALQKAMRIDKVDNNSRQSYESEGYLYGPWSKDEHKRFIEGLRTYGKDW